MSEAKIRNADVTSKVLLANQFAVHKEGGTIDDLMRRIDGERWDAMTDEERNARRASMNVRRSTLLKRLKGEFQAERTDLENELSACGAGTDDFANEIRERIRTLNNVEATKCSTFELSRRGRTGEVSGVSLRDLLDDIVLGDKTTEE